MKTVYLTNIPAPYREDCHEIVYKNLNRNYLVIYCSKTESDRKWKLERRTYRKIFLKDSSIKFKKKNIYIGFDIINILNKENPNIIILNGLAPTMIFAFIWAKIKNCKIIASTDANILTENLQGINFIQKLIRILIYKRFDAYIGASKKSLKLFEFYGAKAKNKFFVSHYSYPTKKLNNCPIGKRQYDIILCGQFIKRKLYDFSIDVIEKLIVEKKELNIKIIGYGPMKDHVLNRLNKLGVNYNYRGSIDPSKIIKEFSTAKLFLFPTKSDGWGVVANEACIAGTPVITCNNAGAANELIINNFNGLVLKLKVKLWSQEIIKILNNERKLKKYSKNASIFVKNFDSSAAAKKIIMAVKLAIK